MTDEKTRALIAALRANVNEAARGTPPTMAAKILAGESDDDRLALMVQAADALDALSALTVPDGDARERLLGVLAKHGHVEWDDLDVATVADAILAAIPIPSRDIAGEIEAEIEESVAHGGVLRGLRRAAEIARNGR